MSRRPEISRKHRICIICEGFEEIAYLNRLIELNLWGKTYSFHLINAKSASSIPATFQNEYQNDRYELILIFCDTDKLPYREYSLIKQKINGMLAKQKAAEKLIIFANPCTMQIILLHFGDVSLKNQGKKTNASIIEKWTGITNYDAHEDQIQSLCRLITYTNYLSMRRRVADINKPDTESGSSNFIIFLDRFESSDIDWIEKINRYLKE